MSESATASVRAEAQAPRGNGPRLRIKARKPLPRWQRLLIGAGGLGIIAGTAFCMSMQSPMPIGSVVIDGASPDLQPQVASALGIADGESFRGVDTAAAAERITAIEGISGAELRWSWWNTLTVSIDERTPAGVLADPSGAFIVVDSQGAAIRTVPARPAGLIVVQAGDQAMRVEGLLAAQQVPAELAAAADVLVVEGSQAMSLRMLNGATVILGGAGEMPLKLQLAQQLLAGTGAQVVNVSVPDRPAVSQLPPPPAPDPAQP